MLDRRVERVGRVLHDGDHRHDGRVPRGALLSRAGEVFTVVLLLGGVGAALYTFTLLATVIVEGGLPEAAAAAAPRTYARDHQRSLHHLRLRPHRQHRRAASSSASRRAVRRHRARSRAAAGGDRRRRAGAWRRTPAAKTCLKRVGIERARGLIAAVGTDAENVYAVLSARVHAAGSVHRRPRRNRGRDDQAEARRRRSRDLAVSDRRRADRADGAAAGGRRFRRARDQHRQPRARHGGDSRSQRRRRWRASRFSRPTCGSGSASSSSAFSGRIGGWSSIPSRTRRFEPATSWSCSAGPIR